MDGSLTVLAHQLALIPTGGEYEVLCHEFKCQNASGGHVLVYVDAADGRQERILLLQEGREWDAGNLKREVWNVQFLQNRLTGN